MAFDNKYYSAAEAEMSSLRAENTRTLAAHENEIKTKHPEIAALSDALAGTSAKLFMLISDKSGDISTKLAQLEQENLSIQAQLKAALKKHGYEENYLEPIYSCKICKDTGIAYGKRCSCFMEKVKKAASDDLNKSSPLRLCNFKDFSLSYYDDTLIAGIGTTARKIMEYNLSVCRKYADDFHLPYKSLLMRGKTGLGKTHLSLSIASEVLAKGYSVIYGSAPDIFRRIEKEHFNNQSDEETLDMVIKADLLVLDDVGAEFESKFYVSAMYNIINDRMNASLPTIVSTNLEHSELGKRYGERTYSRLSTMDELFFAGSDVRIKKAEQM